MAKAGINVSYVNLKENGHVDLLHLESLLQDMPKGKCLVSLMHANNEIGNLLDVKAVGALCKTYEAYFHCDMVQTVGHLPLEIKNWGVHFLAASAHKFNGPKGVGFIYIDNSVKLKPFITGGAQERNMRGGTENIQSIAGMTKALEMAYAEMEEQTLHISGLKTYMKESLEANIPGIYFNGDCTGNALYTVLNVSFPPSSASDMLMFMLDIEGIAVSGGSACSSGSDIGSHVLNALSSKEGFTAVRFSFGKYNTKQEVDYTIDKLMEILKLKAVV
jgi:cysteine desulfurase